MNLRIYTLYLLLLLGLTPFTPVIKAQTAPSQSPEELPNRYQLVKDHVKRNNYIVESPAPRRRTDSYFSPRKAFCLSSTLSNLKIDI
jgi:hypothetical protein